MFGRHCLRDQQLASLPNLSRDGVNAKLKGCVIVQIGIPHRIPAFHDKWTEWCISEILGGWKGLESMRTTTSFP